MICAVCGSNRTETPEIEGETRRDLTRCERCGNVWPTPVSSVKRIVEEAHAAIDRAAKAKEATYGKEPIE